VPHRILAIAGSPRQGGNSSLLLEHALRGAAEAEPASERRTLVLNDLKISPCQNCGFCAMKGYCQFAESDDMGQVYELLDDFDRFILASPIYFASVSAQLKAMIDRCQAIWSRKYLLKHSHPNPDRRALFLCCGGFKHRRFYRCARQVICAWCAVLDIRLTGELFYPGIDARGDVERHPTALQDAFDAGKALLL